LVFVAADNRRHITCVARVVIGADTYALVAVAVIAAVDILAWVGRLTISLVAAVAAIGDTVADHIGWHTGGRFGEAAAAFATHHGRGQAAGCVKFCFHGIAHLWVITIDFAAKVVGVDPFSIAFAGGGAFEFVIQATLGRDITLVS